MTSERESKSAPLAVVRDYLLDLIEDRGAVKHPELPQWFDRLVRLTESVGHSVAL